MNKKVYIAGAISKNPSYIDDFKRAERVIKGAGHTPVNPVKPLGFKYKEYIDMGLSTLAQCDAIYLLRGWEESAGALLEMQYAKTVGIQIICAEG